MSIKFLTFFLLVCSVAPFVYSHGYSVESVKSNIFSPLVSNKSPKEISECGKVVTEGYGLLTKTFKRGQVDQGTTCTFTLRAPANHVVNVISVAFDLQDQTSSNLHPDTKTGSLIGIYDGVDSTKALLTQFQVTPKQLSGGFVSSVSSKEDLIVKVTYRDHEDFDTQKVAVKYQFISVDDMKRLLQASG